MGRFIIIQESKRGIYLRWICFQAQPEAVSLILGTVAVLISSTSSVFVVMCSTYAIQTPNSTWISCGMIQNLCCFAIWVLQPKYGGKIVDIVSRDFGTPEQKSKALSELHSTILEIILIVLIGYIYICIYINQILDQSFDLCIFKFQFFYSFPQLHLHSATIMVVWVCWWENRCSFEKELVLPSHSSSNSPL